MNDIIFNMLSAQGTTIPIWIPIIGGIPINSPLVGSFLAIVVSVAIATYTTWRTGKSNRRYIDAVKLASDNQIAEMRKWNNLKRELLLKALIEELEHNIWVYDELKKVVANKQYAQYFFNFILIATEKYLGDTPIDDDEINRLILKIYFKIKVHDNKIRATGSANITEDSLKNLLEGIVTDYTSYQELINNTIKLLRAYEIK